MYLYKSNNVFIYLVSRIELMSADPIFCFIILINKS